MSADETFEKLTKEMFDKFFQNNPDYATQLGLHDPYDYLLPEGQATGTCGTWNFLKKPSHP
jgi:hypothetical protein